MKWKVCGMRNAKNIAEVATLHPDYMGFIMWEGSKRYCPIPPEVPEYIIKVGVFVDASLENIENAIEDFKLGAVQLHGSETPSLCRALQGKTQVIKAFSIGKTFDFDSLVDYLPYCDFFLFDTKGTLPGGNGSSFDWTLLNDYPFDLPFFLSGGIGLAETEKINEIRKTDLPVYALDVNSTFEVEPGLKNAKLLKVFKEKIML